MAIIRPKSNIPWENEDLQEIRNHLTKEQIQLINYLDLGNCYFTIEGKFQIERSGNNISVELDQVDPEYETGFFGHPLFVNEYHPFNSKDIIRIIFRLDKDYRDLNPITDMMIEQYLKPIDQPELWDFWKRASYLEKKFIFLLDLKNFPLPAKKYISIEPKSYMKAEIKIEPVDPKSDYCQFCTKILEKCEYLKYTIENKDGTETLRFSFKNLDETNEEMGFFGSIASINLRLPDRDCKQM